jgi:hypothetical protein
MYTNAKSGNSWHMFNCKKFPKSHIRPSSLILLMIHSRIGEYFPAKAEKWEVRMMMMMIIIIIIIIYGKSGYLQWPAVFLGNDWTAVVWQRQLDEVGQILMRSHRSVKSHDQNGVRNEILPIAAHQINAQNFRFLFGRQCIISRLINFFPVWQTWITKFMFYLHTCMGIYQFHIKEQSIITNIIVST